MISFSRPATAGLQRKFQYEPSRELVEALRPEYQERLDANFRHPDSFQFNGYSLAEFKAVYIGSVGSERDSRVHLLSVG